MEDLIIHFSDITSGDQSLVGSENTSLGELFQNQQDMGITMPDGFAVTAKAYRDFISENGLAHRLRNVLKQLDTRHFSNLKEVGAAARAIIRSGVIPFRLQIVIMAGYDHLQERCGGDCRLSVHSSVVADRLSISNLPLHQVSYFNIKDDDSLLTACHLCYEALFADHSIKCRALNGIGHLDVAMAVSVQQMVYSGAGQAVTF